jgi:hypothetical protein
MTDVRVISRRRLVRAAAAAFGWDIGLGWADDPVQLGGRAALAARFLAQAWSDERSAGPIAWATRRHALLPHASRFSFWSPGLQRHDVVTRCRQAVPAMTGQLLRELLARQGAAAERQQRDPQQSLVDTVARAAWGWSNSDALGTPQTRSNLTAADLDAYVRRCLDTSTLLDPASPAEPAARRAEPYRWAGGTALSNLPGQQCRLGVRIVLNEHLNDRAALLVLADLLGGPAGLVSQRLRAERGLVYGSGVMPYQEGPVCSLTVGVSFLLEDLPKVVAGVAELLVEIDGGALDRAALCDSVERAEQQAAGEAEGPFGPLNERRRTLDGHPPADATVAAVRRTAARLGPAGRLSTTHRYAIGAVADVERVDPDLLEQLR